MLFICKSYYVFPDSTSDDSDGNDDSNSVNSVRNKLILKNISLAKENRNLTNILLQRDEKIMDLLQERAIDREQILRLTEKTKNQTAKLEQFEKNAFVNNLIDM